MLTGQLPVKKREPTDSTNGGTNNGFAYEFPDTSIGLNADGPTYPTLIVHGTETSLKTECSDEYVDSTTNSGFGDAGSTPGHLATLSTNGDTGYDRQAIVFYDNTDGEEFFLCGVKIGGGNDQVGFGVFKDTDGHWVILMGSVAIAYDKVLNYWTAATGPYDTDPILESYTSHFDPLAVRVSVSSGAITKPGFDQQVQGRWYAANSALYSGLGASGIFGNYVLIEGGTEAIVITGRSSAAVRVPV